MKTRKYNHEPPPPPCAAGQTVGNNCRTELDSRNELASCGGDGLDCRTLPMFVRAEPSKFHDKTLIEATKKIQAILASIPAESQGRKLSLIVSRFGIMLAWVYHENRPEANYSVTMESDDATLIKALKLKL